MNATGAGRKGLLPASGDRLSREHRGQAHTGGLAATVKALISVRNLPRLMALAAALAMMVTGLLLCRSEPPGTPITHKHSLGASPGSPPPLETAEQDRTETNVDASPEPAKQENQVAKAEPQGLAPGRTTAGQARRPPAEHKPLPASSLPPFLPPLYGADMGQEMGGPPPGVLWLSGVIQGQPKMALLRRDENRYLVREGETIEGRYRVIGISANSVTLQRGSRKQTLRLGQY